MKYRVIAIIFVVIFSQAALNGQSYSDEQKYQLAQSYENSGDLQNASRLYIELFTSGNYNTKYNAKYFEGVARTLKAQNKYTDLIPHTEKALQQQKTAELYSLYAELLWRSGDIEQANSNWTNALQTAPKNTETYSTTARSQIGLRLFDKAIETYLTGRKTIGQPTLFSDDLSQLYIATGNFKKGSEEILLLFESTGNIALAEGRLSALMTSDDAKKYINELLRDKEKQYAGVSYKHLYAWFLKVIGNLDLAMQKFVEIDEIENNKGRELLKFANTSRTDGKYDYALKAYAILLDRGKTNPFFSQAMYGYARTLENQLEAKDDFSEQALMKIIEQYNKISKEFPNSHTAWEGQYRIAYLYFNNLKDNNSAENYLLEIIKSCRISNITAQSYIMLSDIYIASQDLIKAQQMLEQIVFRFSKTAPEEYSKAMLKLAQLEYFRGNIDSAKVMYGNLSTALESDIANDALSKIVLIEQNLQNMNALKEFAAAEYYELQISMEEASEKYAEVINLAPGTSLADESSIRLAELKILQKKFDDARQILSLLINENSKSIYADKALMLIGDSYNETGMHEEAAKTYRQILVDYPRSIYLDEVRRKIRTLRNEKKIN